MCIDMLLWPTLGDSWLKDKLLTVSFLVQQFAREKLLKAAKHRKSYWSLHVDSQGRTIGRSVERTKLWWQKNIGEVVLSLSFSLCSVFWDPRHVYSHIYVIYELDGHAPSYALHIFQMLKHTHTSRADVRDCPCTAYAQQFEPSAPKCCDSSGIQVFHPRVLVKSGEWTALQNAGSQWKISSPNK